MEGNDFDRLRARANNLEQEMVEVLSKPKKKSKLRVLGQGSRSEAAQAAVRGNRIGFQGINEEKGIQESQMSALEKRVHIFIQQREFVIEQYRRRNGAYRFGGSFLRHPKYRGYPSTISVHYRYRPLWL